MRVTCPCGDIYALADMGDLVIVDGVPCIVAEVTISLSEYGHLAWMYGYAPAEHFPELLARWRASERAPAMVDTRVGLELAPPVGYEPPAGQVAGDGGPTAPIGQAIWGPSQPTPPEPPRRVWSAPSKPPRRRRGR